MFPGPSGDEIPDNGVPEKCPVGRASVAKAASPDNPPPPKVKKLTKYQREMDAGFQAFIADPANLEGLDVFPQPPPGYKKWKKRAQGEAEPRNSKKPRTSGASTIRPPTQPRQGSQPLKAGIKSPSGGNISKSASYIPPVPGMPEQSASHGVSERASARETGSS